MNQLSRVCLLGLLCATTALSSGCGLFGGKESGEPPAPLVEFKPSVRIKPLWSVDAGADTRERYLQLAPLLDGERLYLTTPRGELKALQRAQGKTLWTVDTGLPLGAPPGLGADALLVAGLNGEVQAREPQTGKLLWQAELNGEILAAPQAHRGVVVVQTLDGRISGLSRDDGSSRWVYQSKVPLLSLRGTSTPLIRDERVYAGLANGRVIALDLSGGQVLWRTQVAPPTGRSDLARVIDIDGKLQIEGETLYVSSFQGRTAALDPFNGDLLWVKESSVYNDVAVDERQVYISDERGHVWALDRYAGSAYWKQDKLQARRLSAPARVGQYVVVGDFEGYLHWLRVDDGQFAARTATDGSGIRMTPVVAERKLYVLTNAGKLFAFELGDYIESNKPAAESD